MGAAGREMNKTRTKKQGTNKEMEAQHNKKKIDHTKKSLQKIEDLCIFTASYPYIGINQRSHCHTRDSLENGNFAAKSKYFLK